MSPNVGNFVHDLVEMAKAMETLPIVERQLNDSNEMCQKYAKQVQDREIAIIGYKEEIETLHAKVRSLEVERDDASFRVMEAEDREHVVLNEAKGLRTILEGIITTLDPPKPEPVKEPEPIAITQDQRVLDPIEEYDHQEFLRSGVGVPTPLPEAVHSLEDTTSGQSEGSPTAPSMIATATADPSGASTTIESASEPTKGPYSGKLYHDYPAYVSYWDWIDGGGTDDSYSWHPTPPIASGSY